MDLKEVLENLDKEENKILFYKTYKKPIFLYVLNIAKDYHLSEDITSEVFMRISKYYKGYKKYYSPKTWIFTIARNTTYTYLKKNRELLLEDDKLEFLLNKYNRAHHPDSLLTQEYIACLGEVERNIFILHVYGGLSHLETSKILNMNYAQVRAKYTYARKKLKEKVNSNEK